MHRAILTALGAIVLHSAPASAETPSGFLAPAQAAEIIADGRPWSAATASGRSATLTLNPDGTGKFEGPMTFNISWDLKGPDLCIKLGMPGTKCTRFRPIANGYEGFVDGKLDLTLSR